MRQDTIRKWQSTVLSFLKKRSFLLEYLVRACLGGVDTLQMPISCTKDIWIEHFLQIETTREETLSTGIKQLLSENPKFLLSINRTFNLILHSMLKLPNHHTKLSKKMLLTIKLFKLRSNNIIRHQPIKDFLTVIMNSIDNKLSLTVGQLLRLLKVK